MRYFGATLHERKYGIQGDKTEQKAEVVLFINRGRWQLKEVICKIAQNPCLLKEKEKYSRDDWKFLKELAIYIEYICSKADKDKLEMDIPEKEMNVLSW